MALTKTPSELTAADLTITTAAQPNITSLGTLTALQVDNVNINGNTISSTDTNGNIVLTANGTGNVNVNTDVLAIQGTEGESASLALQADESDDAGDEWRITTNTNQTLSIQNNISGSGVDHMTFTPHATVGSSTVNMPGIVLIGADSGDAFNADSMLRLQRTGDRVFVQIKTDDDQDSGILFGTASDDVHHQIFHDVSEDMLKFKAQSVETLVLDAGSHVGIKTSTETDGTAMTFPLTISGANDGGNILEAHRTANSKFQLYMSNAGLSVIDVGGTTPKLSIRTSGTDRVNIHEANGYVGLIGSDDVRLTLSSNGTEGDNSANWVRGNSAGCSFNALTSGKFYWEVGGTEKMRLDNNAFLSIGNDEAATMNNASGYADICVGKGASDNAGVTIYSGTNHGGAIAFADGTSGDATYRGLIEYAHGSDQMNFRTAATDRMSLNSARLHVNANVSFSATATDANRYNVYWNSSTGGLIVVSSDQRLKKDFDYDLSGIETIKKLKPVRFTWKESEKRQLGFVAQEAITADEHLAWNDTENDQWGLDGWEGYAAMLTKAIQEQQALIETLEAKVKALEEA